MVIVADDSSDNTKKNFRNMCEYYKVPVYFFSNKEELGHAIGKEFRASLAILDEGLKIVLKNILSSISNYWCIITYGCGRLLVTLVCWKRGQMANMRVHELAKELNISSKDITDMLSNNEKKYTAMSGLGEAEINSSKRKVQG